MLAELIASGGSEGGSLFHLLLELLGAVGKPWCPSRPLFPPSSPDLLPVSLSQTSFSFLLEGDLGPTLNPDDLILQ